MPCIHSLYLHNSGTKLHVIVTLYLCTIVLYHSIYCALMQSHTCIRGLLLIYQTIGF